MAMPKIYIVYIGNPGGSTSVRTALGLTEANAVARKASQRAGHARVTLDNTTVAEWHLGVKQ